MKLGLVLVLCAAVFVIGIYSFGSAPGESRVGDATTSGPETIVQTFCKLSREGDFDSVRLYITDYPADYYRSKEQEIVLYKKAAGQSHPEPEAEPLENSDRTELASSQRVRLNAMIADNESRRFFRDSLYIREVKNIWIKNDQARVRVALGSKSLPSYIAVQDFLLYNDKGWKVFLVDDSYGYNVYGVPHEQIEDAAKEVRPPV